MRRRLRKFALHVGAVTVALSGGQALSAPDRPLAYLAVEKGYWQVWLAALDGGKPRVLTRSPYDKTEVSWFPDGERVLVNGAAAEMAIVNVVTGKEAPIKLQFDHGSDATVSPDGTQMAFSAMNAGSPDTNDIWISKLDGSGARKIASMPALQHEPVWAPDGKTIYFLSGPGGQAHDIYRVSTDGKSLEQMTTAQLYHFDLNVGADGAIVFSSNRSGNYDIWVRDAAGKERVLVGTPEFEAQPVWLPGQGGIVFTRTIEGVPNLWTVGADGVRPRAITKYKQGARAASVWRAAGAAP
jgi:TolB protein